VMRGGGPCLLGGFFGGWEGWESTTETVLWWQPTTFAMPRLE
jgi:hypothetical protein